nr:hypothetical protein [Treponema sp.]
MNFVSVCKNCGRTIESDFFYCPWCGFQKKEPALKSELEDEVFDKLESQQVAGIEKRICEMKEKLDELERDFASFVADSSPLSKKIGG